MAGGLPARTASLAGDRIALCVRNGVGWVAIDLAALGMGLVVVPLYVDDNAENVAWCVAHAEARLSSSTARASRATCGASPASLSLRWS